MVSGVREIVFLDDWTGSTQCRFHFAIDCRFTKRRSPLSIGHKGLQLTHSPMIWSEHKEDREAIDAPIHSPADSN
jgi:hypothetical protein